MFSEARLGMNRSIKAWLNACPKRKEWAWFCALWLGGFLSLLTVSFIIKALMSVES